jgi:hypothetical protein
MTCVIASERVRQEVAGLTASSAKQSLEALVLDCFVAALIAMTVLE